ncbi:MAG: MFS transporter [Rhodospirillales bacterium]|nr:MFS transporter [Rhodospirillales bacterium]
MTRRQLLLYALPAFALGMPTIPVYVFLPSFYAEEIGVGLAVIGGVLLAARIADVVTDSLVGLLSDKLTSRWGRRKPWMIGGAIAAAAGLLMLFMPPATAGAAYLLIGAVLLYLGWTAVSIPYSAWGAELSPDYSVRSRITGAREGLQILGVLVAASVPALAALVQASRADGLAAIAWLAIALGIPAFWASLSRVAEPKIKPSHTKPSFRLAELSSALRNQPFLRLLCAWFANGIANGIPAALFPLYLGHVLKADEAAQGILVFAYFLCGVLAIPGWLALSRRLGKHRSWCAAMIMACAAFIWVPLIPEGGFLPFLIVCVITGAALGADLALPPAMQADVIDFDTLRTGQARAGLFFALWSMGTKLALAVAVGLAFPALQLLGFDAKGANTADALTALAVIYALVPIVFKLCAVAMVWRHPIDERRHRAIIRRLRARDGRHVSNGEAGALTP